MNGRRLVSWTIVAGLAALFAMAGWAVVSEDSWAIEADIAESCSCNVVCPCLLGSPPTHGYCEGSRLIEIKKGFAKGVDLSGIPVVATFSMGKWVKISVGGDATDEQIEAASELIAKAFPTFVDWGIRKVEKVPVTIDRGADRMRFTTPTAVVDIKAMTGRDGKPITIQNFAPAFLDDYMQWVSEENSHAEGEENFEHSGTNGFTSKLNTSG